MTDLDTFPYQYNNGGFEGKSRGDCVARSLAIACDIPYKEVTKELKEIAKWFRPPNRPKRESYFNEHRYLLAMDRYQKRMKIYERDALRHYNGVNKRVYERFLEDRGWEDGLRDVTVEKMPEKGVFVLKLRKHLTVLKDGVIHDTYKSHIKPAYSDGEIDLPRRFAYVWRSWKIL